LVHDRQAWLATLAHAPREALSGLVERHVGQRPSTQFEWLRAPETGLTMVQARVGGTGDRFNLGETTLTRCVVRHRDVDGHVAAGIGYVKGRDAQRARWVAMLDALLQQPAHHADLMRDVIEPLRTAIATRRAAEDARTAASRVRFFTLTAGNP
jgi:alpha-D-ribose 1-methylphosphonate 5-triphosphate synthase subunit PhnG